MLLETDRRRLSGDPYNFGLAGLAASAEGFIVGAWHVDRLVGAAGLAPLDRDGSDESAELSSGAQVVYWIGEAQLGHNYAARALRGVCGFAFESLDYA